MKAQDDSLIPDDWKKIARKDWERVKRNLRDDDAEFGFIRFKEQEANPDKA